MKKIDFKLIRIYTIHGEAFINPFEISGILPKSRKDISPYILMKTGDKFYISELDLMDLISHLKPYLAL